MFTWLKKYLDRPAAVDRMMRVRYVGLHPGFQGQRALAKFDERGNMLIQVNGKINNRREPECYVNGTNYAIGWHRARKSDWSIDEDCC